MECMCGSEERQKRRSLKLRRKYEFLRKQHKKLLGVTIELTQVLEEYVRGRRAPNVSETLSLCEKIYPSLFDELSERTRKIHLERNPEISDKIQEAAEKPKKASRNKLEAPMKEKKRTKSKERPRPIEEEPAENFKKDVINEEIVEEFVDGLKEDLKKSEKKKIKKELLAMAEEEYYDGFWSKKELPRTPLNP